MNRGARGDNTKRVLRRSRRNRVTVVHDSNSETEYIKSEAETVKGWDLGTGNIVDREESESVEGSEYNLEAFSNTAYHNLEFEEETRRPNRVETVKSKEVAKNMDAERSKGSIDSGRGVTPDAGLGDFMRMYLDEQKRRDDRRDQERREERAEAKEREERLWTAMSRTAATPEPETRRKPVVSLPVMKESEEISEFLDKFETALTWGKVPKEMWREMLVSHIPIELLMRAKCQLDDEDSTYEEIVGALGNSSTLTFGAAAEDLCTGERGRIWEQEGRKAAAKIKVIKVRTSYQRG